MLADAALPCGPPAGERPAARNPIYGATSVARFLLGTHRRAPNGLTDRPARINGSPGLVGYFGDGRPQSATTFGFAGGRISEIRLVVNPDKLEGVRPSPPEAGR